jgi:mono/diheme cytochrome c family protein
MNSRWLASVAWAPLAATLAATFALTAACDMPPSPDHASTWTPADHDRAEEQSSKGATAPQARPQRGDGGSGGNAANATEQLAQATWESTCFVCHGSTGHGDGPNGPMAGAKDLTREEWQSQVTDAQIAAVITTGKGRMPKFDLSPKLVDALVARIRAYRGH